jgi:hypothetical protein
MNEIEYTSLRNKLDLAPRRTRASWAEFSDMLRETHRTTCSIANCERHACEHKEGQAWSPTVYPPNAPRQRNFAEEVSLLVVDLDHLTNEQLAAALVPLAPYQRIIHASHSDRPRPMHADRCVRAIVAINRPVTRSEWPRFWPAAMVRLKQPADPACCDIQRIYYLPSQPKDAKTYFFEVHDGVPLSADAVLATAAPEAPATNPTYTS